MNASLSVLHDRANSAAVACTGTLLVIVESYVEMHLHSRSLALVSPLRSRSPQKSGAPPVILDRVKVVATPTCGDTLSNGRRQTLST